MPTDCRPIQLSFEGFEGHQVVGALDGGTVTSNAGALLLREADRAINLTPQVARCFRESAKWPRPCQSVVIISAMAADSSEIAAEQGNSASLIFLSCAAANCSLCRARWRRLRHASWSGLGGVGELRFGSP